jgi:hypothetical protein
MAYLKRTLAALILAILAAQISSKPFNNQTGKQENKRIEKKRNRVINYSNSSYIHI